MSKKPEEKKMDLYELNYKTTCTMKVLVQAPSRKAAEAWSETHGDEFVDDLLEERDNDWDEQEGGFEEVIKLKKAEAEDAEPHVVVDEDGEPVGQEEEDEEEELDEDEDDDEEEDDEEELDEDEDEDDGDDADEDEEDDEDK